jgi:hypothetical protein
MTRHKTLQCVHEPFGDAYYFGPERLAERYESDPQARKESGYSESTYRTIFDRIAKENSEVRTLFLVSQAQDFINFHFVFLFVAIIKMTNGCSFIDTTLLSASVTLRVTCFSFALLWMAFMCGFIAHFESVITCFGCGRGFRRYSLQILGSRSRFAIFDTASWRKDDKRFDSSCILQLLIEFTNLRKLGKTCLYQRYGTILDTT